MELPSGSSSPQSSKSTTPLQSRLQPCSGWLATTQAASRSVASAVGHGGRCRHIVYSVLLRLAVLESFDVGVASAPATKVSASSGTKVIAIRGDLWVMHPDQSGCGLDSQ
jgi:hypothetical protein